MQKYVYPSGLGRYSAYNEVPAHNVSALVVTLMTKTFRKLLVGEDSADHFAIRIPPSADLQRNDHL